MDARWLAVQTEVTRSVGYMTGAGGVEDRKIEQRLTNVDSGSTRITRKVTVRSGKEGSLTASEFPFLIVKSAAEGESRSDARRQL